MEEEKTFLEKYGILLIILVGTVVSVAIFGVIATIAVALLLFILYDSDRSRPRIPAIILKGLAIAIAIVGAVGVVTIVVNIALKAFGLNAFNAFLTKEIRYLLKNLFK